MMQGGRTMTRETNKKGWGDDKGNHTEMWADCSRKRKSFFGGGGKKKHRLKIKPMF